MKRKSHDKEDHIFLAHTDIRPARSRIAAAWLSLLLAVALAGTAPGTASAQPGKPSLEQLYAEAKRKAETPEGREKAIADYRAVVETHLANEKLFQASLRQLMLFYSESERAEEGMRLLLDLAESREAEKSRAVLQEAYSAFNLKYPEIVKKVLQERGLSSGPSPRGVGAVGSKDLAQAILQRQDKQLREKSLDRLRQMLSPDTSVEEKRMAMATLRASLSANYDRGPFLSLVVPLLESEDWQLRMFALECLPGLGATSEHLPKIAALADDPNVQVRKSVARALILIGKGAQAEIVVPALMKLLRDADAKVVEDSIRSMWGQYSTPEFDQLLIELSHDSKFHSHAIYHGLSTMRTKSVAVCRRLVEELNDPDWNNSGRAAWGLAYGVVDEARQIVEEGLLKALPEETNNYTREQEFRALRNVASEKSRAYLKSVVESNQETEASKQRAQEILNQLDAKPKPQ